MIDELSALRRIEERFPNPSESVSLGIGDDAAAVSFKSGNLVLSTTDSQVEDVHFIKSLISPSELAHKAVAVSVSDIAAMGGVAKYILASVGFSDREDEQYLDQLITGFTNSQDLFGVDLIGGNLSSSKVLFIDITVLGEVEPDLIVKRSGASPGDKIFVSGTLGDSALGLKMLQSNQNSLASDYLKRRHLSPLPRLALGRELAVHKLATSMIDVSDGLHLDLERITVHRGSGAVLDMSKLPTSEEYDELVEQYSDDKNEFALSGGEDYELLFTSHGDNRDEIKKISESLDIQITEIGEITSSNTIELLNSGGKKINSNKRGFVHFNS